MWEIKDRNGNVKAVSNKIEYSGEWMGECFVTVTVESPVPIDFRIGDRIEYRGDIFEINYDPSVIKSAPLGVKGDGFKYENIKLNSFSDELTRCNFLDIVLGDNGIHYTSLPDFSFYAANVKDLADRIQANLDKTYQGERKWTVEVHPEYADKTDRNISVNNLTCWDALALAPSEFGAYFIIRGRHITIGVAGIPASHVFKYGKGNGLYEIERAGDDSQLVVTRLRAFGNTTNLPFRYYHNLPQVDRANAPIHSIVSRDYINSGDAACALSFRLLDQYVDLSKCHHDDSRYWFVASVNGKTYAAYWDVSENCYTIGRKPPVGSLDVSNTLLRAEDMDAIGVGTMITFECCADNAPGIVRGQVVPNNMAVNRLMLPGFPVDTLDPYIDSPNIEELGIREHVEYFDGHDDDHPDIHPSIEGMTAEHVKNTGVDVKSEGELDVLIDAEKVEDDGVGVIKDGTSTEPENNKDTFTITLKDLGFDINEQWTGEQAVVSFTNGMLGGREFEIVQTGANKPRQNADGTWILTLNRTYDDDIKLWFPYKDYNAAAGDKFVILHIDMPDVYIKAASQRLLKTATEWLSKNDYARNVYTPKVDEIFMARQHKLAIESNGVISSLHDTIREGMQMLFIDDDLNVDAAITIDKLTIKEGEGPVPTYEVTLKEEKTVGSLERIQNQIDSLARGMGQGGGGYTAQQIRSLILAYGSTVFLCKNTSDRTPYALSVGGRLTAETEIGSRDFAEGLTGFGWQVDASGNIWADSLSLRRFLEVPELRYNRTEVIVGNQWQAPGAGIVEKYEHKGTGWPISNPTYPDMNYGVITLKLEDGEIGSLQVGDFCMGIWHFGSGDSAINEDQGNGVFHFAGFTTVYFHVEDVTGDRNQYVTVRTRLDWNKEPIEGMHFVAYGNNKMIDGSGEWMYPERQKSAYRTRTYERYLVDVHDWNFGPSNIAMQFGDLSNLTIDGVDMSGYSAYLNNIYMTGVIRQLDLAPLRLNLRTSGDHYVGDGDDCLVMIYATKGVEDVSTSSDLTLTATCDGKKLTITRPSDGNYLTLGKSLLAGRDKATVTVTAKYIDYRGKTYSDSATIDIYDKALLKGDKGDAGVGWQSDKIEYARSTDATTPPVAGWTLTVPSVPEGEYLWTRVTTTYTNGDDTKSYSVTRMGKDGTALTVKSTEIRYAVTKVAVQPADSAFTYTSINAANPASGDYVWCRIKVTYSDNASTTSYSVSRIGSDGDTGNSLHIAYAKEVALDTSGNAVAVTGFSTVPFDGYGWIGTYADSNGYKPDSTDFKDYAWTKARGEQGSSYTENLLTGTRAFTEPWTIGEGASLNGTFDSLAVVEANLPKDSATSYASLAFRDYALTDGETYTLSFWARTGVSGVRSYVHVPIKGTLVASDGIRNTAVNTTPWYMFELGATEPWRRYRITFVADSSGKFAEAHSILFRCYNGNAVQLAGVKLERGDNPDTEWSPATEEMLGKDAVTYEWSADPGTIRCNADGVAVAQTLAIKCTQVKGDERTDLLAQSGVGLVLPIVQWRQVSDGGVTSWVKYTSPITIASDNQTLHPKYQFRVVSAMLGIGGTQEVLSEFTVNCVCDGQQGEPGEDGQDGKDGKDGKDGADGPQGAVVRIRGLFEEGDYHDGRTPETTSDGAVVYWLDVVWVTDSSGNRYYRRCTKSGHYTSANGPKYDKDVNGWAEFSQLDNLIVDLLIANNAHIKFLSGQEIVFGETINGVEKIWGRVGVPLDDGVIMYAGGSKPSLATYTLDKNGKTRYGESNKRRIEIDPVKKEMRVYTDANKEVVTVDGDTHDIAGMYGCEDKMDRVFGSQTVFEDKTFDFGTVTIGEDGATFSAGIQAQLYADSYVVGQVTTQGTSVIIESQCSANLILSKDGAIVKGSSVELASPTIQPGGSMTSDSASKSALLEIPPTALSKGTYRLELVCSVTNQTHGTGRTNASVGLSGYSRTFKAGNSPKALLCANGLIVSNSTQDYLVAGISDGTFMVEAHAGGKGLRVGQNGILMQNDNGEWTQNVAEHCINRPLDVNQCYSLKQGVIHWMTDDNTKNLPTGASKYGALTTYTIDNGGKNQIQEYRSYDTVMQLWSRARRNGIWGTWNRLI